MPYTITEMPKQIHFHYASMAIATFTCLYARLLGPCFKTGRYYLHTIIKTE